MTIITASLSEDQYTCMILFHSIPLRMRNVSDDICREKQNKYFILNNFFLNPAVYEIKWKTKAEPDRPQMKIRRMSLHAG